MPNLNHINRVSPFSWNGEHGIAPLTVPLSKAPSVTGLSRSTIYREAARGSIKLVKAGRSTLVCMDSVRAFLASLPTASIRAPQPGD